MGSCASCEVLKLDTLAQSCVVSRVINSCIVKKMFYVVMNGA